MKLTLLLLIMSTVSMFAQILNGGFEQWTMGEPDYWLSNNIDEPEIIATPITQSSFAHDGSWALKGEVVGVKIQGQIIPVAPILQSGNKSIAWFPYSGKPDKVRGYYNFHSVGGDGFIANVFLLSSGNPVAVSGVTNYSSTAPGYHELIFYLNYIDTVSVPDAMQLIFQIGPAPGEMFANVGSEFHIDHFPKMLLIKPPGEPEDSGTENLVFIAGEVDTIKWDAGGVLNIDIKYSTDSGTNYQTIVNNYPGDSSRYFWRVPESLLTRTGKIKILEHGNPSNELESIEFTIKPWQLTRIDANDELQLFEPNQDGWSFENSEGNMWPESWWQQFSYKPPALDPYTNAIYPDIEPFRSALQRNFPDWSLFVDVFTVERCYISVADKSYRASALNWWTVADGRNWVGSCFGFSASSLAAFYFKDLLLSEYPEIGEFNRLYSLSLNDDRRKVINEFYISQYELGNLNYRRSRINTVNAQQTLAELKDMFRLENGDARPLAFYDQNGSGAHSVVPYKLVRLGNESTFELEVYDSENPGSSSQYIEIDSVNNLWTDFTSSNLGTGVTGFFLELPSAHYLLGSPVIPFTFSSSNIEKKSPSLNGILIFNTSDADIVINSGSGGQIGYQDSVEFGNITDGVPIIPLIGRFHPPIGYYLPENTYSLQLNDFSDSLSYAFFITDSTLYNYKRYNAINNDMDLLNLTGNGLGITNPDQIAKSINLETIIISDSTSEKVFVTSNVQLSSGDSIHIMEKDRTELLLQNYGETMNYDLQVRIATVNGGINFLSHVNSYDSKFSTSDCT